MPRTKMRDLALGILREIADGTITSADIAAGAIDSAGLLGDGIITTAKILAGSISSTKIASGAIDSAGLIADSAITDAKISGMSSSKLTGALPAIDGSALTGLGVADGSITTAKLADLAVTDAKISGMASSKLTGALPAIDGSALTGISSGITVSAFDYTGNDGYVKYSDGLIWQWGFKSDTGTTMTVSYPISFPNRVFNVQMQMIRNSVNYQNTTLSSGYATSLSSFLMRWDSAANGIVWLAVGN